MTDTKHMSLGNFERCMAFFGYTDTADKKRTSLYFVLVEGRSQREACTLSGYSASQLSLVMKRVRKGLADVEALTNVRLLP